MKIIKKSLITLCVISLLVTSLSVHAYAADTIHPRADLYKAYYVQSFTNGGYLDVASIGSGSRVTLSGKNMTWVPGRYFSTLKLYLGTSIGQAQMVISYNAGNVVLAPEATDNGVTKIAFDDLGGNVQRIYFPDRSAYLTEIGGAVFTRWLFGSSEAQSQSSQYWLFTT